MSAHGTTLLLRICRVGLAVGSIGGGALAEEVARRGESVDLTVVSVGVAVVDRDGSPIRGLKREEFEVRVDGRPQPITNFAEAPAAGAGPAHDLGDAAPDPEPRYLAVLLNDRGGSAQMRARALRELEEAIPALQRDGWRFSLTAIDTAVHTLHGFDDDPTLAGNRLHERAAARVQPSIVGNERQSVLNAMDDISIGLPGKGGAEAVATATGEARDLLQRIRALARAERQQGRAMVSLLTEIVDTLARLPGSRSLVYVGEGFDAQPGTDLLLQWAGRYPQVAARELRRPELEAGQFSLATEVGALGSTAAAADVTVFYVPTSTWASGASADVDREGAETTSDVASASRRALGDALAHLAQASGGARLGGDRHGVPTLVGQLSRGYSIGFRAPTPGDHDVHRVEVAVSRPGARVRHRTAFRIKSTAEQVAELTAAALGRGDGANPLAAAVERRDATTRSDGRTDLSLAVTVPMRNLALVPERTAHRGEVTVFVAVGTPGQAVEVRSLTYPVLVDNDSLFSTLAQEASFAVTVVVEPGATRAAVTVLDTISLQLSTVTLSLAGGETA